MSASFSASDSRTNSTLSSSSAPSSNLTTSDSSLRHPTLEGTQIPRATNDGSGSMLPEVPEQQEDHEPHTKKGLTVQAEGVGAVDAHNSSTSLNNSEVRHELADDAAVDIVSGALRRASLDYYGASVAASAPSQPTLRQESKQPKQSARPLPTYTAAKTPMKPRPPPPPPRTTSSTSRDPSLEGSISRPDPGTATKPVRRPQTRPTGTDTPTDLGGSAVLSASSPLSKGSGNTPKTNKKKRGFGGVLVVQHNETRRVNVHDERRALMEEQLALERAYWATKYAFDGLRVTTERRLYSRELTAKWTSRTEKSPYWCDSVKEQQDAQAKVETWRKHPEYTAKPLSPSSALRQQPVFPILGIHNHNPLPTLPPPTPQPQQSSSARHGSIGSQCSSARSSPATVPLGASSPQKLPPPPPLSSRTVSGTRTNKEAVDSNSNTTTTTTKTSNSAVGRTASDDKTMLKAVQVLNGGSLDYRVKGIATNSPRKVK